jgi:hypothetical protein
MGIHLQRIWERSLRTSHISECNTQAINLIKQNQLLEELAGNQIFKKYSYVSWLTIFHNTIHALDLNSIIVFKWPFNINVTKFAIPTFTWINMYGMIYWTWNIYIYIYHFVSWFKKLSQYHVSIFFLLRFGMVMQYLFSSFKRCHKTQRIYGIPYIGYCMCIEYFKPLAIPLYSLNQNNLAHGVYWMPQTWYCFAFRF